MLQCLSYYGKLKRQTPDKAAGDGQPDTFTAWFGTLPPETQKTISVDATTGMAMVAGLLAFLVFFPSGDIPMGLALISLTIGLAPIPITTAVIDHRRNRPK